MTPEQMMSTLRDINRLKNFANGGYWNAIDRPNKTDNPKSKVDKYGRGFNGDARFSGLGSHTLFYFSKRGYYGCSDCYTILELDDTKLFWNCFDEYLNKHQDEILNAVADIMQMKLQKEIDVLKQERDRINSVIDELTKENKNE